MKLSIAWIFDHLEAHWRDYDIAQLVAKFNTTTAEVEHFSKTKVDLSSLSLAQVMSLSKDTLKVFSPEWQKEFLFPSRPAREGDVFMITEHGWATMRDLQGEKDGLVPALFVVDKDLSGAWKERFEAEDYILELDNKSITHRPDMWCHRGFAREVAAILDIPLKPLGHFLETHEIKKYETTAPSVPSEPFTINVKNQDKVKHFSGLYIEHIESEPSLLWMAHRLIKIDSKPIGAVVDCTNYVMQDIGQPMHAFDAGLLTSKKIEPRLAQKGETIVLLDGQKVELESTDLVITDAKKPIALAGIMGGRDSAINEHTESVFLEAACFDAATIRKTSSRLRLRTDASARFEKSLDSHMNNLAIQRFLKLVHETPLATKISSAIASIGREKPALTIEITQHFIESRLGEKVSAETIKKILEKLEFGVKEEKKGKELLFTITVPTFRATKDVGIKEDIVEEVGRFVGYSSIPLVLPAMSMQPKDLTATRAVRALKHHCAYALAMHEVQNYSFYDEEFLPRIQWYPENPVSMKNPVSENWKSLVTSLIPHLFKNVYQNEMKEDRLRFFECGRVWHFEGKEVCEQKSIAGIFFDRKKEVDFYAAKADLGSLFEALDIAVDWEKPQGQSLWEDRKTRITTVPAWYNANQTAVLLHNGLVIGYAGKAERSMLSRLVDGDAFLYELNGDFITSYNAPIKKFTPISKYPVVWLDISMLVPLQLTVATLSQSILKANRLITHVELVDFFEKAEWKDQRSLTFRYYVQDPEKTLEKDTIDAVSHEVVRMVQGLGVTVR